jgi:DHA2 family multidrug resistance protein
VARRSQFHQQTLGDHLTASSAASQQAFAQLAPFLAHQGADPVTASHEAGGLIYGELQKQAALLSYSDAFYLMGIFFLANIPLVFLMRGAEHNRRHRKEP